MANLILDRRDFKAQQNIRENIQKYLLALKGSMQYEDIKFLHVHLHNNSASNY